MQVQEAERVPIKLDAKRTTPRHIIIKMPEVKDKERISQEEREKQRLTYKVTPIRLSADFSKQILQARRGWQELFKVMKSKDLQPKCFQDKVMLKEFIITKPLLHKMLKGLI